MKLIGIIAILSLFVLSGCFADNAYEDTSGEISTQGVQEDIQEFTQEVTEITEESLESLRDETEDTMPIDEEPSMQESESTLGEEGMMMNSGEYRDYSADMIGNSENTVIFFAASWCPSCVAADKNLSSSDIPAGLTVLKADFDSETALRREYGVVAQHTFVSVDSDGNQLRKWVGGTTIDDIVEKL